MTEINLTYFLTTNKYQRMDSKKKKYIKPEIKECTDASVKPYVVVCESEQ